MKKVLAAIMSLIIVLAVGTSCTNKKAEDEYKAKVKEDLDAIPVEATGYELALRSEADGGWQDNEIMMSYYGEYGDYCPKQIGCHVYDIKIYGSVMDYDDIWETNECYMDVAVDDGELKRAYFNYKDEYKSFKGVALVVCFEEKIFVIRCGSGRWKNYYREFFPPTLFLYDYETNELKYLGYSKDWFDYRLPEVTHNNVKIVKK